jgi:hypothetical protein
MDGAQFVGTWRLVSAQSRSELGEVIYPYGADAGGRLIYTNDGFMAVFIARANRPLFGGNDLLGGTSVEQAAAAVTFLAYTGRYTVQEGQVIHHVDCSLFPNWVGMDQVRFVQLQGETLTIYTGPILIGGVSRISSLIWQRESHGQGGRNDS